MKARRSRLHHLIRRILKDRSGAVLIYTALALPVLLGVAALSVDVSLWHVHKRVLQKAADAAAVAGALEILRTGDQTAILAVAEEMAAQNGYDSVRGDLITVNHPPTSGPNAGASDAVEVIIRREASILLAAFAVEEDSTTIAARAVATGDFDDSCVVVLNPTVSSALSVSGTAEANIDCGVVVNSTSADAITQSGTGSCLRATKIKSAGGYSGTCIEPTPMTNVRPILDPLRELQPPSYGTCDITHKTNVNDGNTVTLTPDADGILVVCGDIAVLSGTLNLDPGLYVLDGAGFSASAQAVVQGTDVHIYMTDDSKSFNVSAGADVDLRASAVGELAGVLVYQDRNADPGITHSLTGGGDMNLSGILYFPATDVKFSGGSASGMTESMIIADTVSFSGGTNLGNLSQSPIYGNKLLATARLVE